MERRLYGSGNYTLGNGGEDLIMQEFLFAAFNEEVTPRGLLKKDVAAYEAVFGRVVGSGVSVRPNRNRNYKHRKFVLEQKFGMLF